MIRVERIDHVVLRTAQVDALVRFYRDVLGCAVERTLPPDIGLIQLRAGDALIDIVDVDSELGRAGGGAPRDDGRNLDHFCLYLAPITEDALCDWLARHGVDTGPFERRYGATGFGPSLYIHDPDGNTVELKPAPAGDAG
jgi:catechol 2,3-dioxygenase-like lactoylglutathione lyase family enzyme